MRVLPVLFAAMVFTTPALAEKPTPEMSVTFEADTYRYGDLYRSERGTTIEDCAMMCSRDNACASWSLTPATFRLGPRCELKHTPGAASHRPGAASGMSEFWQMDAGRHAEMRYQPSVPESRQPAAVPLEDLRPSPVPRVFGDPPPLKEPELLGGPKTRVSAVMRRDVQALPAQPDIVTVPARSAVLRPATEVAAVPQQLAPPQDPAPVQQVAAPAPKQSAEPSAHDAPHPLYGSPVRFAQTPKAPTVFKDPARERPDAPPIQADYNAVLKRERQTVTAQPAAAPAQSEPAPAPAPARAEPAPMRTPWTERTGRAPDYSVGGTGFIPGDEDATAGFVEGAPEAGT